MAPADSGISRDSVPTGTTLTIILVFLSVAMYNVVELTFIILATFKRRRGLYFWSFIVATWGIAPYVVGFLIKAVQAGAPGWLYSTLIVIGWCCMVTGQSVVLYSRLHIVLRNEFRLRLVLYMIIANAIICHVPIIVMVYGANSANPAPFVGPYSIYERVQVTLFFLQEAIISALYIHETLLLMRARKRGGMGGDADGPRKLMVHLITVNAIIVILDITILGLEYAGLYDLQTAYKAIVYSIKLKLEFSILNRLVEMTQKSSSARESSYARTRAEAAGVQLEPFDVAKDAKKLKAGGAMGNSVYVQSGPNTGAGDGAAVDPKANNGVSVLMTTQVTVHSSARGGSEFGGEGDAESVGNKSSLSLDSTVEGTMGQHRAPSHSSQRQIVDMPAARIHDRYRG